MGNRVLSDARGVLICANPFSGSGPNRGYVDGLVGALSARGFEPRLVWDIKERRAALADPGLRGWCRCVVVAGGDGSIGAVVNELGEAGVLRTGDGDGGGGQGVALATMPMGNENLFAKQFGFTRDVEGLAGAIEAGRTRRVDLGRASSGQPETAGQLFTLMASVGFDAEVVHRMDRWRSPPAPGFPLGSPPAPGFSLGSTPGSPPGSTQWGLRRVRRISYLPRIASSSWGYKYPRLTVEVDGRERVGSHLFVFNLPAYGGGLGIAPPGCRGDDGLLDWVLFDRPGVVPLLGYVWSVWRGRHLDRPDVKHGRAATLTVSASANAPVQVDGDPAGRAPVVFRADDQMHLELLVT